MSYWLLLLYTSSYAETEKTNLSIKIGETSIHRNQRKNYYFSERSFLLNVQTQQLTQLFQLFGALSGLGLQAKFGKALPELAYYKLVLVQVVV